MAAKDTKLRLISHIDSDLGSDQATLGDLVRALVDVSGDEDELVATLLHMVQRGRVTWRDIPGGAEPESC